MVLTCPTTVAGATTSARIEPREVAVKTSTHCSVDEYRCDIRICLVPKVCNTSENYTRRRSSIDSYATSWVAWALNNQRELAQDEPINTVMHLGTHNSFNTRSDGHIFNGVRHVRAHTTMLRC